MAEDLKDLNADEAVDRVSRTRSEEKLDAYEQAENDGKKRSSVLDAIASRREELGGEGTDSTGTSDEAGSEFAGAIINPGDEHSDALSAHDADPQGAAAVDAAEVTNLGEELKAGTHVRRGPDGKIHQVAQVITNF